METKYYDELEDFFDDMTLGDELVIVRSVNNSRGKNYGKIRSIKPNGIKVRLKDGDDYEIMINSYDKTNNTLKVVHSKKQTVIKLNAVKELYAVLKYRDDDTGQIIKVLGKFNPHVTHANRHQQQQEENKKKESYNEFVQIANEDDIVYTDRQRQALEKNLDEIKEVIKTLEDGDILYIYQAPMMDLPSAIKDYWEDWIDEHGNDTDSIIRGSKDAPGLDDMYDQNNVNRISFKVEVDDSGEIYVRKPVEQTSKNSEIESYLKKGHHFNADNFVLDEDDFTKNIGLYGQYSLEVDSIFDVKKTKDDEDDPDHYDDNEEEEGSNEPMTDAEIMKMIANDKQMMNFLMDKPTFLDFIRSGGKKRKHKPFTANHFRLFKNAIDGYENGDRKGSKKYKHATIIDLGSSVKTDNGRDLLVNQNILVKGYSGRGGKVVLYLYDEKRNLLGKVFSKDGDIYDSDIDEFNTKEVSGEFKNKEEKTPIKIKIE